MEYLPCKVELLFLDGKEIYRRSIYLVAKEFFQDSSELKLRLLKSDFQLIVVFKRKEHVFLIHFRISDSLCLYLCFFSVQSFKNGFKIVCPS